MNDAANASTPPCCTHDFRLAHGAKMQLRYVKLTILALLAGGCAASQSLAQDAAPADWSGFYAGVYAGYGLDERSATSSIGTVPYGDVFGTLEQSSNGVDTLLAGVRAGWSHQSGGLVFGLESALTVGSFSRSSTGSLSASDEEDPPSFLEQDGSTAFETNAIATLAGRLGVAVDNWMLYGKAGVAAAHGTSEASFTYTYVDADDPEDNIDFAASGSTAGLLFGAVIGVGAEMLVTENISIGAEYSYVHLPSQELDLPLLDVGNVESSEGEIGIHSLQAGVNFHF